MKVKRSVEGKIEGSGGGSSRHGSASHAVTGVHRSFGASVEDAMEEMEVRELLESLGVISGKLTVFPAERLLMEYRRIIKELLKRAMKGYSLQRDLRWRRTDRNLYVTIEKTENALAELEKVFKQESGRTRALQLMEEIKGCIVSLLF
ncbi:hypothetical protein AGMMS49957_04800 [Synergistales bacterium]|nr:hypothetical protein AGMMS49957_04800 [Synergistales bacterium]